MEHVSQFIRKDRYVEAHGVEGRELEPNRIGGGYGSQHVFIQPTEFSTNVRERRTKMCKANGKLTEKSARTRSVFCHEDQILAFILILLQRHSIVGSAMTRTSRRTLFENGEIIVKGLVSNTVPEPPVDVFFADELVGRFHGIEVYERAHGTPGFPQTVADLVSNTYFRLTYQKPDNSSATFGTSFVGSCSFRTADNTLHHLPTVMRVDLDFEPHLRVRILGRFEDLAEIVLERTYRASTVHRTVMTLHSTFVALKEIELSSAHLGIDAFRLFSISSMYAGVDCYDGNLLRYRTRGSSSAELDLRKSDIRGRYLFSGRESASEIFLLKQTGSMGRRNTPGSPDSPSVRATIVDSTLPLDQIGIQAVLVDSTNPDDDSLSIWCEWLDAPSVLRDGLSVSSSVECSAFDTTDATMVAESLPNRVG